MLHYANYITLLDCMIFLHFLPQGLSVCLISTRKNIAMQQYMTGWNKSVYNSTTLNFFFVNLDQFAEYFSTLLPSCEWIKTNVHSTQDLDATQGPTLVHFTISLRIHPGKSPIRKKKCCIFKTSYILLHCDIFSSWEQTYRTALWQKM